MIIFDQHARAHEPFLRGLVGTTGLHEIVPTRGRKADPKITGDLTGKATALKVIHHFVSLGMLAQRVFIELTRVFQRLIERFIVVFGRFLAPARIILGHFQAHALSQTFHCLAEIEPFIVHHEPKRVPPSAAAKAVVELPLGVH